MGRNKVAQGVALVFCSVIAASSARADAVTEEIDHARSAYLQGKFTDAKQSLDMASQLVVERKAKILSSILPPPFLGWRAEDKTVGADTAPTGAATALGGITAGRTYRREDKACSITLAGDSPLLTMVSMFLANPSFATTSGARVQRLGTQRAVITQDGEVEIMTANHYLVTLTGDCSEADKLAYAGAVDYVRLGSF